MIAQEIRDVIASLPVPLLDAAASFIRHAARFGAITPAEAEGLTLAVTQRRAEHVRSSTAVRARRWPARLRSRMT